MVAVRAVHQLVPHLAYGDGVGNQVLAMQQLLRQWGYASMIYAQTWDKRLASACQPYRRCRAEQDSLLIWHFCAGGDVNDFAAGLPLQNILLYYHNLTPARFYYRTNGVFAAQLMELQQMLHELPRDMRVAAASVYNRIELQTLGFQEVGLIPYRLTLESLSATLNPTAAEAVKKRYSQPGSINWLHVGRLAPNKRIEHVIDAYDFYRRKHEGQSRLFLVGSAAGNDEYAAHLQRHAKTKSLAHSIIFAGHMGTHEGLGALYSLADVYVCLSEHEGFCLPLVEAMHFDVPVIAYATTGVPYTLGPAGILVRRKNPELIAEIVNELQCNESLRSQLIAGQRARLADFTPEQTSSGFKACLANWIRS